MESDQYPTSLAKTRQENDIEIGREVYVCFLYPLWKCAKGQKWNTSPNYLALKAGVGSLVERTEVNECMKDLDLRYFISMMVLLYISWYQLKDFILTGQGK